MARDQIHETTRRALLTWAAQKRKLFVGEDGYQPLSVIARIRDEREGASQPRERGAGSYRWLEIYSGDGILVQRIAGTMPPLQRAVLASYWMFQGPYAVATEQQAEAIAITRAAFWAHLKIAESRVDTGLQLIIAPSAGGPS